MKGLCGAFLISVAVTAALLLVLSAPFVSAGTVKVVYDDVPYISVEFPNGKEIESGGVLVVVTYSNVYDMEKTGIWFYEYDPYKGPDTGTSVTDQYHYSVLEGNNTVRHVFTNLTKDVEMDFSDPVYLDPYIILDPFGPSTSRSLGDTYAMPIIFASMLFAFIMLGVMIDSMRRVNSMIKERKVAP